MDILLPEGNHIICDGDAEVKDGKLFIYKSGIFKDIMYEITYLVYEKECYYCKRKYKESERYFDKQMFFKKITLDHLIPQDFGGPTIPNNLRICCGDCNSMKDNMFEDEFITYRSIIEKYSEKKCKEAKLEKKLFKEKLAEKQERRRYGEIQSIPSEWFAEEDIQNVFVNFWVSQPLGMLYKKYSKYYKKYKTLPKPVILSSNRFLLDGFNTILLAKYNNLKLKAIVLDNVIFVGFPIKNS